MKKVALTALLAVVLLTPVSYGNIATGIFKTYDDTNGAGMWSEQFKGGGPGQYGNTILSYNSEYLLEAVLQSVTFIGNSNYIYTDNGISYEYSVDTYETIYQPGPLGLVLFEGPWDSDPLPNNEWNVTLDNIIVTNYKSYSSIDDHSETNLKRLAFELESQGTIVGEPGKIVKISGTFDSFFDIFFEITPDDMSGYLKEATIQICGTNTIPAPGALILGSLGSALVAWLRRR